MNSRSLDVARVALPWLVYLSMCAAGVAFPIERTAWADDWATASPEQVGLSAEELQEGVRDFEQALARDEIRGAVLLVARRGKLVLHESLGWADKQAGTPMTRDTRFHVASNTKPIVAAAVLRLVEEGRLELDAEIGRYLPAFARDSYRGVTVRRLLNHTSGLRIGTVFVEPLAAKSAERPEGPTLRSEVDRFAEIAPAVAPGTSYSYNNPGYNILGALIETVEQQPLEKVLARRFFQPLGMTNTTHEGLLGSDEGRANVETRRLRPWSPLDSDASLPPTRYAASWETTYRRGAAPKYPFVRASGGIVTTAADYARWLQMIVDGGRHGEQILLKPETILAATSPAPAAAGSSAKPAPSAAFSGLGWQVESDGTFGHGGSDGTYAWVDPKHELLGVVFTQSPGGRIPRAEFQQAVRRALGGVKKPLPPAPLAVGHRGLPTAAPENSLAGFAACAQLRVGIEVDVRRSRDGQLVCVHDEDLLRTTGARGRVADLAAADLKKLNIGSWFAPAFHQERVPLIDEVLATVAPPTAAESLVALDLKIGVDELPAGLTQLITRRVPTWQVVCIGRAIDDPAYRQQLRMREPELRLAVLAATPEKLDAAVNDPTGDWVYVRFVPTAAQVSQVHRAGKRVFIAGPTVAGVEPLAWGSCQFARVDAVLTDHPLEASRLWRGAGWPIAP